MFMIMNKESGGQFLTFITSFVNTLLNGKCHPAVTPILFEGNLVALEKRTGDVRPIAIVTPYEESQPNAPIHSLPLN